MPFFPQIDPLAFGAPPPAPSPYGQSPMPDLSGIQALVQSMQTQGQGFVDRNLGNPTQLGQSPEYYGALTGGGTGAQNDRFSAMYAPDRYRDEVALELASDPVFGGAFASQGNPSVTQYAAPQQPAAGPITNDSISQMLNQGIIDGRASGVSTSPDQVSSVLQGRLEDRADREAFNQRRFGVSPFAGRDGVKVLGMMYEAELAQQQMQAQAAELAQKERMARWLGQNEIDSATADRLLRGKQIDADIENNSALLGIRRDEYGLNKLKTQAEITAMGRENQIASPLNPDQYLTRKAQLEKDYGPVRGAQVFEEEMAALDKRFGYRPPGSEAGGLMGSLGSLLSGLLFGGSADSPVSTTGSTHGTETPSADGLSYLRPKTFSGFGEGFNAESVYGDPLANYQDYFANAVPPDVQTRLKAENNAWFPAFAMGDLDQDIAGLRSAEGNPLNPREAGAIRRAIYGNSWTPWVDSMLYEY